MTAKEHHVSRIVDGVTLSGTYSIKDGIVTVKSSFGSKATQVGDCYPYNLALIMLRELLDDARTGGPLPSSWLDCSSDRKIGQGKSDNRAPRVD